MKDITITFTADEFVELAKQLYLGSYLIIAFPYDNEKMASEIYNKVCETGYHELPELEAFRRLGPLDETEFGISGQSEDEAEPIIEQYEASAMQQQLPYGLADRDFQEKYGKMEIEDVINNNELLQELVSIQEKYKLEFERYGVTHLRLEEREG